MPRAAATLEQAPAAKAAAHERFSRLASVVGVGITRIAGGYGIQVNVRAEPPAGVAFPERVGGVPVQIEVVGAIRKR
jgi:hypothetical protein